MMIEYNGPLLLGTNDHFTSLFTWIDKETLLSHSNYNYCSDCYHLTTDWPVQLLKESYLQTIEISIYHKNGRFVKRDFKDVWQVNSFRVFIFGKTDNTLRIGTTDAIEDLEAVFQIEL